LGNWQNFFISQAGASAALAGLVFVSISINLQKILSFRSLPSRAIEALGVLLAVLAMSSLLLVPNQSATATGLEVLAVGLAAWIMVITIDIKSIPDLKPQWAGAFALRIGVSQIATLPPVVAGIMILVRGEVSDGSLYWIVPGFLASFGLAFLDAWVLLVEINR
jgi:modulator of FtsH protease